MAAQTPAQQSLGDTAPELVRLTDEMVFGQVWADPGLSQRDRSLATVAAYREDLMPHILAGEIHPGRVFDRTLGLDEVAEGYRLMNDREALKVLIRP